MSKRVEEVTNRMTGLTPSGLYGGETVVVFANRVLVVLLTLHAPLLVDRQQAEENRGD